jgi:hypothetical protein
MIDIRGNENFKVIETIPDYIEFSMKNQCNMAPLAFPAVYFKYKQPSIGPTQVFWIKIEEGEKTKAMDDLFFMLDQSMIIEHRQDSEGISKLRKKYGKDKW